MRAVQSYLPHWCCKHAVKLSSADNKLLLPGATCAELASRKLYSCKHCAFSAQVGRVKLGGESCCRDLCCRIQSSVLGHTAWQGGLFSCLIMPWQYSWDHLHPLISSKIYVYVTSTEQTSTLYLFHHLGFLFIGFCLSDHLEFGQNLNIFVQSWYII